MSGHWVGGRRVQAGDGSVQGLGSTARAGLAEKDTDKRGVSDQRQRMAQVWGPNTWKVTLLEEEHEPA